jgi:hypothetical protein
VSTGGGMYTLDNNAVDTVSAYTPHKPGALLEVGGHGQIAALAQPAPTKGGGVGDWGSTGDLGGCPTTTVPACISYEPGALLELGRGQHVELRGVVEV